MVAHGRGGQNVNFRATRDENPGPGQTLTRLFKTPASVSFFESMFLGMNPEGIHINHVAN